MYSVSPTEINKKYALCHFGILCLFNYLVMIYDPS